MSVSYPPLLTTAYVGQAATAGDAYTFAVYQNNPANPAQPTPLDLTGWTVESCVLVQSPSGAVGAVYPIGGAASTFAGAVLTISQQPVPNTLTNGNIEVWEAAFETVPTMFPVAGTYVLQGVFYLAGGAIHRTRKLVVSIDRPLEITP